MRSPLLTDKAFERRMGGAGLRRNLRGGGRRSSTPVPVDPNLAILLAAPGAACFFDGDYGYAKDGSNKVSLLVDRIGGYSVSQGVGANQPTWGATSASGRRGIIYAAASSQRLVGAAALAAMLDGTQQVSALFVASSTVTGSNKYGWSIGSTTVASEAYGEGASATSGLSRSVRGPALVGENGSLALGAVPYCATSTLTTNGALLNTWVNGAASEVASAAHAGKAPTCDGLSIGALLNGGAFSSFWEGEFYALILSTSIWTLAERQALEAAAKAYWGTP